MRDDGQVVVFPGEDAADPLRKLDVFDLGDDPDLGQLCRDHLAALARIGRRRQLERQLQRGFDAGFGQQRFSLLDIEGVDAGGVHIAKGARNIVAAYGNAITVGTPFDDGLAIDCRQDGAAHAYIVERFLLVVDGQDGLGAGAADDHLKLRVGLELGHGARGDARERIHVTGKQSGDLGRRVTDESERRLLDLDRGRVAVTVPFRQHDRRPFIPGLELVRSGADGFGCIGVGALGLHDDGRTLAQIEQELRVQLRVQDHQRVVIDHGHAGHAGESGLVLVDAFLRRRALERKLDGGRVERLAVLELHAFAQLEGIGLEVGRHLPTLGQQRREGFVGVDLGQCLENVVQSDLRDCRGCSTGRVQPRRWLQCHGQHDRVFLALGLHGKRHTGECCGRDSGCEYGAAVDHGQCSL